jgi:hypothetical protein
MPNKSAPANVISTTLGRYAEVSGRRPNAHVRPAVSAHHPTLRPASGRRAGRGFRVLNIRFVTPEGPERRQPVLSDGPIPHLLLIMDGPEGGQPALVAEFGSISTDKKNGSALGLWVFNSLPPRNTKGKKDTISIASERGSKQG